MNPGATLSKSYHECGCGGMAFHWLRASLDAPAGAKTELDTRSKAYSAAMRLPERGATVLFKLINGPDAASPLLNRLATNLAEKK
jgi:hypothetical protein